LASSAGGRVLQPEAIEGLVSLEQWPTPNLLDEPGTIRAVFAARSYAPGEVAPLRVFGERRPCFVQIFRAGLERLRPYRDDSLVGTPVSRPQRVTPRPGKPIEVDIGSWPSGFYFARLTRPTGELGFAPFVLRPALLGASRVLVVLPTHRWQAYNFRDVDGDGIGDTWYASRDGHVVDLGRSYLRRGVPPHFRGYDRGFVRWVARTGKEADFVANDDLDARVSGDALARAYDLIVFSGHDEYTTPRAYDVVLRYRDLGGNIAFLSANKFHYRVTRRGDLLHGREPWHELGRPAATFSGSDYVGSWKRKYPNRPYVVTGAREAPWFFVGTGLRNGDSVGRFGIEVDATGPTSPPGTRVLARIPNIFGPGRSAEMTYHETSKGARVFAAGVMNFGGSVAWEPMATMLENVWRRLSTR
jgi:hypothetical protein